MDVSLPPLPVPVNGNSIPPPLAALPDLAKLERELPTVTNDLIPLSYLIDRLVTQSYSDLTTLIETLPSHSDQQRKQLLVDYVLHTRRQFIKLLVLTRWSAESERIRKSINIIGFLSNQNHQIDTSIQQLTQVVEGLKGARVRNYDLETSLNVLQRGTYDALPSGVREAFEGQEKLKDEEVIETMRECEHVMRWRLKMGKEEIPKIMLDNYRIADGRVTFRIEGLWEASFVYSGTETQEPTASSNVGDSTEITPEDQSEWYILGIKFLFNVKDERGNTWNSTPTGPLKQHMIDLCNAQLARRPFLPPPPPPIPPIPSRPIDPTENPTEPVEEDSEKTKESELSTKYASELQEARTKRTRDQPLQRGYTFLQRLALSYQLESVYSQAVQLIRSDWNACGLKVEMNGERDEVKVRYWSDTEENKSNLPSNQPQPQPTSSSSSSSPSPGGTLIFSVSTRTQEPSKVDPPSTTPIPSSSSLSHLDDRSTTSRREKALESLLNRAQSTRTSSTSSPTPPTPASARDYPPSSLQITCIPSSLSSSSAISQSLQGEGSLDLEKILNRVTKRHARETIEVVEKELKGGIRKEGHGDGESVKVIYPLSEPERGEGEKLTKRTIGANGMDFDGTEKEDDQEEEEEEEEEEVVPYLCVPLVGPYAMTVHVDSKSGRVDLRSTTSTIASDAIGESSVVAESETGSGEGEGSREARLRSASERINSLRFSGGQGGEGNGDAWIKGLPDVIAKIRATTTLDEISTLFTLLSLPTLRRLPLPPRELSKFGPLPSLTLGRPTFLFVPLNAHSKGQGLEGFYLSIVLMEDGIRMVLVGTRECTEESSGSTWIEITEVGWIFDRSNHKSEESVKGKEKERETNGSEERGSNFGHQVSAETLRKVWSYCAHRILVYRLERQLHSRQISYRSSSNVSTRLSIDVEPPPYLILKAQELVRLPLSRGSVRDGGLGEGSIVLDKAALRCQIDDETKAIRTTLHVRLNPSFPVNALPPPFSSVKKSSQDGDKALATGKTLPRNVFYNPSTRALVLLTENEVLGSVERLLRAYAGVIKEVQDGVERIRKEGKVVGKLQGDG
ncbi:hypothetical protein JCM16303_005426 [Sporobolomyces ruberrimus]